MHKCQSVKECYLELPQLPENFQNRNQDGENIDIVHETELGQQMLQLLNDDQRHIHDTVMEAIQTRPENNYPSVHRPAGTGKIFL